MTNESRQSPSTSKYSHPVRSVAQITFSGNFGGRENVAFSLTKILGAKLLNSVLYLVLETRTDEHARHELLAKLKRYGLRCRVFETDNRFSMRVLRDLKSALVEDNAQIVHCHCYKSALYASLIKLIYQAPVRTAFTLHGLQIPFSLSAALIRGINYLSLFAVDSIIGCSSEIVQKYRSTPFLRKKISVIQNGLFNNDSVKSENIMISRDVRSELATTYGLDPSALWIGNVGRLTKQKNFPLFLHAAAVIRERLPKGQQIQFLVAGDGELRNKLMALAKSLGIGESVYFLGYVSRINELYAAIDILTLTSDWEGTPMCILEGMSQGLPIVAAAVGGVVDLIEHEISGLLFAKGNVDDLVACLLQLIQNPAERDSLGQTALKRLQDAFTPEVWRDRHIELYKSLLSG